MSTIDDAATPRARLSVARFQLWTRGSLGPWPVRLSVVVLALYVLVAVVGPSIAPHSANQLGATPLSGPSGAHWFGTDDLGRDEFSRCLSAVRIAVLVAVGSVSIGLVVGTLMGVVAGLVGGWIDAVLMRTVDVKFAFPDVVFALVIVAAIGSGLLTAILAISFVYIPRFARIVRTATRTVATSAYVEAARLSGVRTPQIIARHVLPNITAPIVVMVALSVGTAQLAYASLAFLGFGARPPQADFGTMIAVARPYMTFASWLVIFPALCLVLFTVASSFVGDAVRDALDPRLGRGGPEA